ncbi:hypothetical protein RA224_08545 [Achromobacter aegrifaciens]|uniref:hypothetical protein n=1 Tax=Achromobacter aegrifaciens TaxID=1287736 RepID=UPI0027B8D41B|nr:hypothetical protein [Achromobacter aegrifaciens]WLW63458.1 hypothetical protein RA224_08545 [Achromobacter aegrifaciens]
MKGLDACHAGRAAACSAACRSDPLRTLCGPAGRRRVGIEFVILVNKNAGGRLKMGYMPAACRRGMPSGDVRSLHLRLYQCAAQSARPDVQETNMQQPAKTPPAKQEKARSDAKENAEQQRQKAETAELLGRHKNTGQKDHKGAR